jgi:pimeloyl-ACP methyl ester carboxylesterase
MFSFKPNQVCFGVERIAEVFASLMTDVLGYRRFGAQGGDWGGFVASRLGYQFAEHMIGIHLNFLAVQMDPKMLENPSQEERAYLDQLIQFLSEETGYQWIQDTKPTTLAFALTDSPLGLAAWIVEKFCSWTDYGGDVESAVSKDEMLSNIMLHWVTGAIGSSFWPYYARMQGSWPRYRKARRSRCPPGTSSFPRRSCGLPRSVAERTYTQIRRWTKPDRGGHFAALEQPEVLAHEVQEFFAPCVRISSIRLVESDGQKLTISQGHPASTAKIV